MSYENTLQNTLLDILPYACLIMSIISLWIPRLRPLWRPLFALGFIAGLWSGRLSLPAFVPLALLGGACYLTTKPNISLIIKRVADAFIVILSIALFLHLVPGFNNWKVIDGEVISPGGIPYTLYLNFGKPSVGLFLLAIGGTLCRAALDWKLAVRAGLFSALVVSALLMILAFTLHYVRWDPKIPHFTALWLAINLLFTCVAEEAFFRGFIQKRLCVLFQRVRWGNLLGLLIASLLFGLAHYQGGLSYIFLATVAGLFYGWAYLYSGRIESSILTHFALNSVHFFLFTYPALALTGKEL